MHQNFLFLVACGLLFVTSVRAEEVDGSANYAYAIFTGTGKYRISDRTIYVIRMPLEFTLREADYRTKTIGYSLLAPFAAGITNFDDITDIPEFSVSDMQTMSFAPGVELTVPVKANWQIKPFGQAGLGWDMTSSSNSVIWGLGARTRAWFGANKTWLLGGELLAAANNPKSEDEPDTSFVRIAIGTEYKWQTNWAPFDRRVSWHVRLIEWIYTDAANFVPPQEETNLHSATEAGVSFGIDPPVNILGYNFRQLGVGYEHSAGVKAVKLFTTFPF